MSFTVDGSPELEARIERDMERVRKLALTAVGKEHLTALALGGGYGRGEGGIYVVDGEERVYNDYDFFVIVPFTSRSRRRWVSEKLLTVKERLEPECGIHVDFSPPMPLSSLPHQPYELMFMEARHGNHVIHGPEDVLNALPDYDVEHPPLEECARLYMNRGVGLLLAGQKLRAPGSLTRDDHEFVVRNIYKALLAMGDSVLFVEGRYSPSYVERLKRFDASPLEGVPNADRLRVQFHSAMAFKFRPRHDVPEGRTLAGWHADVVSAYLEMYLWFERTRLRQPELDWAAYAALPARLSRPSGVGMLRSLYQNFRQGSGMPLWGECFLQPRDRILKRLPALLQHPGGEGAAAVLKLWSYVG